MTGPNHLRALVLQHEQPTPGGYVNRWLEDRGIEQDLVRIDVAEREIDLRDYDLIVSLGSELAAFDALPWIRREERLLAEAHEAGIPTLGICFGAQLLAKALGGDAFRSDRPEIGWLPVHTHEEDLVARGPWFQWHFDTFVLPPGACLVAESPAGPQAYTIGASLGTQFHPEVTPEIMESWVRAYPHELEREGVDPAGLLAETWERAAYTRAAAWRLFDGFLERMTCKR